MLLRYNKYLEEQFENDKRKDGKNEIDDIKTSTTEQVIKVFNGLPTLPPILLSHNSFFMYF